MLDRLASGGLTTVFFVTLLALGYARVFRAKRPVFLTIVIAAFLTVIGSQFLSATHIFRISIHNSLVYLGWVLVWASPVMAYGTLIWWARRHTKRKQDGTE